MTLMLPDRASSAVFTTPPGTSSPTVAAPCTAKQFVLGTLLAGNMFTATLTAVTPADALALSAAATTGRTLPAAPTPATPAGPRSVADVLNRLRRVSGLSWGEVASAVGVSRRAIHLWLSGGRVAGAHTARLLEFQRTVAAQPAGPSAPAGSTVSVWRAAASRPARLAARKRPACDYSNRESAAATPSRTSGSRRRPHGQRNGRSQGRWQTCCRRTRTSSSLPSPHAHGAARCAAARSRRGGHARHDQDDHRHDAAA